MVDATSMTTKIDDQERAAFEAYFSKPPFEWEFPRYGEDSAWPGNYQNYNVQCTWEGWLARSMFNQDEYLAMVAVMQIVDPATLPGLTVAQRCALGRFASPVSNSTGEYDPVDVTGRLTKPVAWVRPDLVVDGKIQASSFTAHTNYRDGYVPLNLAAPAQPQPPGNAGELPDPIADFCEDQWWVKELDAAVVSGVLTNDQVRAVAVVHHMLRSARAALAQEHGGQHDNQD